MSDIYHETLEEMHSAGVSQAYAPLMHILSQPGGIRIIKRENLAMERMFLETEIALGILAKHEVIYTMSSDHCNLAEIQLRNLRVQSSIINGMVCTTYNHSSLRALKTFFKARIQAFDRHQTDSEIETTQLYLRPVNGNSEPDEFEDFSLAGLERQIGSYIDAGRQQARPWELLANGQLSIRWNIDDALPSLPTVKISYIV